jgi:outer membrane protein assembly factor BamB
MNSGGSGGGNHVAEGGTSGRPCIDCTPQTLAGTLYAHSSSTLYRVDPNNFDLTQVATFSTGGMTDLAVTPDNRVFTVAGQKLYEVDVATGQTTERADLTTGGFNGLTFLASGELLASNLEGQVKRIDPRTGDVTFVGEFGSGLGSSGDLVAISDGSMFGISHLPRPMNGSNNMLVRVDSTTGAAQAVGNIGFADVYGLAYFGGRVLAFTSEGNVIEIDPSTGRGTFRRRHSVSFWGAGVSPLIGPG